MQKWHFMEVDFFFQSESFLGKDRNILFGILKDFPWSCIWGDNLAQGHSVLAKNATLGGLFLYAKYLGLWPRVLST